MRNISFSLTTRQFLSGEKDVTRRLGWAWLQPGTRLMAVEKAQGLKKGEKVKRLGKIEVVRVGREELWCIRLHPGDCRREGFPEMTPGEFIDMFCRGMGCDVQTRVTRIEFRRLQEGAKE